MNETRFYHIMLLTDIPGWEDVLERLDEPCAEIWYHRTTPIPHYHVLATGNKYKSAAELHVALGRFAGIFVEELPDVFEFELCKQAASALGDRYVNE